MEVVEVAYAPFYSMEALSLCYLHMNLYNLSSPLYSMGAFSLCHLFTNQLLCILSLKVRILILSVIYSPSPLPPEKFNTFSYFLFEKPILLSMERNNYN